MPRPADPLCGFRRGQVVTVLNTVGVWRIEQPSERAGNLWVEPVSKSAIRYAKRLRYAMLEAPREFIQELSASTPEG